MNVLIACEFSGIVRDAFNRRGHFAISCDLLPSERPGPHIVDDVRNLDLTRYDLMICHPPCTYLASSGLHWNRRIPGRTEKTTEALAFVKFLLEAPVERIALENPIGCISSKIRQPDQIIQPWQFGHDASKQTCLWLKNLPRLVSTEYVAPKLVNGKRVWGNQTPSGQNKLGPSADRWMLRSVTYPGIADAMVQQWT